MLGRVLVTRPQPGARRTAARLREFGFSPIELPLTRIVGIPASEPAVHEDIDAVVVTSANALRHAPEHMLAKLQAAPCFAVGRETASAARHTGFEFVSECGGSADALAVQILKSVRNGARILYLCGRVRTDGFVQTLESGGLAVLVVETYDAPAIRYTQVSLRAILGSEPIRFILLYSERAAELIPECPWQGGDNFAGATFLCLSGRIANRLERIAPHRIKIAGTPTEEALFRLLDPV